MVGRRLWAVGLAGAFLAATAAVPSGAVAAARSGVAAGSARAGRLPLGKTPDTVYNAQTQPDLAAQALTGCADIANCKLHTLVNTTDGPNGQPYGPPSILGDVLYYCSPPGGPDAYTAVGMSDTRGETTSVSEKLSVTLQGGIIGLASTSLDPWVTSTQSEMFSTTVTTQTQVTVPPGYKGFTTTQILSFNATASYYITRGINLIAVTGVDLSFPGYQDNQDSGDSRVIRNTFAEPINPVINLNYETIPPCNAVNDNPSTGLGGARGKFTPGRFKLTLCSPGKRCVTHTISGPPPPKIRRATAILTRGGRTYATGTDIRGRIRLEERRKLRTGKYRLIVKQKPTKTIVRRNGRRIHAAEQHVEIHIPVKVCGNTVGPVSGLNPAFGNSCQNAKS